MGEESLKASIIVLTYRKFDNLEQNIQSILKQSCSNYEVIVSDDGSPNFDRAYIESLFQKMPDHDRRLSIITREKNVGTVKNFNAAIQAATGDLIIPLSQDDCFYDDHVLAQVIDAFSDPKANICLGRRTIDRTDQMLPNSTQLGIMRDGPQKKLWFRNACSNLYYGATLYYRKEYLQNAGLFDESYTLLEDYPFAMRCIEKGEDIRIIDAPTIRYSASGVSSGKKQAKPSPIMNNDFLKMYEQNYLTSKERLNSIVCRKYLQYRMRKKDPNCSRLAIYGNVIVDIILFLAKREAARTKKNYIDCRFERLWKFEELATKIRLKKSLS